MVALICRLTACTAEGLLAAIISAVSIAQSISSPRGDDRVHQADARGASPRRSSAPVSSRSIACT